MKLRLRLSPEPGALQRVLTVALRRGFDPSSLHVRRDATGVDVDFEVTAPELDAALCRRQLERLYDVESVAVE